ncbi:hypothetical protein ARALYDRAFT_895523 [Arabidopsis lyrata subsp. lyrata]|uniref:Uncharacterized protein n=1 Tax=Arabidopsis lyrata subsp. lyrata TaxID=81972 RepID=D7KTT2_ARALL|nr:hypothetical protein ARALYDRAFT_895523 [Arabidopsis lyrata subsp. lyrata]
MVSDAGGGETRRRRDFASTISECSHRASLMARVSSLGPSDAPCPMESSTAHGESIFWVEITRLSACASSEKMVRPLTHSLGSSRSSARLRALIHWFPATALYSDLRSETYLSFSHGSARFEAISSVHRIAVSELATSFSPPSSLAIFIHRCNRGLGFQILGFSMSGPFISYWTCLRIDRPKCPIARPRSVSLQSLIRSSILMLRHNTKTGQGHLLRLVSTSLQDLNEFHLSGLKKLQLPITHTLRIRIQLLLLIYDQFQNDPKPDFVEKILLLFDLKDLRRPSSSTMERFSAPPSSLVERTCPSLLAISKLYAPATTEANEPFPTSRTLLIVTNVNFPEVFAEVSLTHHDLVCGMLRCSLCLRASMDLSTKLKASRIYLSMFVVSLFLISLLYPTIRLMILYSLSPFEIE